MRWLFFLLSLVHALACYAQDGYSVMYSYDKSYMPQTDSNSGMRRPDRKDRLICSDTLSFWYSLPDNGKDPFRNNMIFGEKLVHHALLFNSNSGFYFSEVAWPKGTTRYLIQDTISNENWFFGNESKEILGYRCRPALRVTGNNDSTLVWFTDSIPIPAGPFIYFGFPGLVLEVYDQVRSRHLIATAIVRGHYQVVMPKEGLIISSGEFNKRRQ